MENGNVDNLLMTPLAPSQPATVEAFNNPPVQDLTPNPVDVAPDVTFDPTSEAPTINKSEPKQLESTPETSQSQAASNVDEYGTPVSKQEKLFTQAELNAVVAQRLARLKQTEIQNPQYPQNPQQPQTQNQQPQAEGDWENQLESFVEKTYTKLEQKKQEIRMREQALEAQTQFEIKFNEGMAKYPDFNEVIYGKPLTPQMVLATRGMNDPAAFIYAASKTQSQDLARISQIQDPYVQAVEIGQLAERMRKARNTVSQAPRPISTPSGDVTSNKEYQPSIEDLIRHDENVIRAQRARR